VHDRHTVPTCEISCPLQSPSFLNSRERVPRIVFQQDELFIGPCADVGGQGAIIGPEICVRPVDHREGPF